MKLRLLGAVCASISICLPSVTPAALVDNGGGLIYDSALNITWAQPDALRTWNDANTWAAGLTLGGVTGWRLPYISVAAGAGPLTSSPVDCRTATEVACRDNELAYMFYQNLSGTYGSSILTSGDPDLALFPQLQSEYYWSGTEFVSGDAWGVDFDNGDVDHGFNEFDEVLSWAVHEGNIGAIPIPPALYLFGTGLIGLIGIARRKKAA